MSEEVFNLKSLTNYFHVETEILADFQICIREPVNDYQLFVVNEEIAEAPTGGVP